jgi:AraC-like DNA-binding protein
MKLYIKYMVSLRCKMIVKDELSKLGLRYIVGDHGVVEIMGEITPDQRNQLKEKLLDFGLELLDDKKGDLIEKIKNVIVEMIYYADELPSVDYSEYISEKLGYDYDYLSNVFSEVRGTTIEQFILMQKIERAKELIFYDELSLEEIASKLHFSGVVHLAAEFKKNTGLSPAFYKQLKSKREDNF